MISVARSHTLTLTKQPTARATKNLPASQSQDRLRQSALIGGGSFQTRRLGWQSRCGSNPNARRLSRGNLLVMQLSWSYFIAAVALNAALETALVMCMLAGWTEDYYDTVCRPRTPGSMEN
jgi:hypothetical protein